MALIYPNLATEEAKIHDFRKQQNNQNGLNVTPYISDGSTVDTLLPGYNYKGLTLKDLPTTVARNTKAYVKQLAMEKQKLALDQPGINKCRQLLYKLNNKVVAASELVALLSVVMLLICFHAGPLVAPISVVLLIIMTAVVVVPLVLLYLDDKIVTDQEKSQHKIEKNKFYLPKLAGMMERIFKEMSKRQVDLAADTTIIEQNIADLLNTKTTTTIDKFKNLSDQYIDCLRQAGLNSEINIRSLTKLQKATEELCTNILTTLNDGLPKDNEFILRFKEVLLYEILKNIDDIHITLSVNPEIEDDLLNNTTIRKEEYLQKNIRTWISAGVKASCEAFSKDYII